MPWVAALLLTAGLQLPLDPVRAEELAREGRAEEALTLFTQILDQNPGDADVRLWVARLALRLGRVADAEAAFRAVLQQHPDYLDATIGLASTLLRKGDWRHALEMLVDAERGASENPDLFGALARAYRRAGDDGRAFEYFRRARDLSPNDPDLVAGYEAVARVYGHALTFEGFGETGVAGGAAAGSGSVGISLRVAPRLHLNGGARVQQRGPEYTDATAGGDIVWRVARATTIDAGALGGSGNTALPALDVHGTLLHSSGPFELGGGIRDLSFTGIRVLAVSPVLAYDVERWRLDTRYTYSRSSFDETGESRGDHSAMLRGTWRRWRRVALHATAAYGIESFETLTADRVGSLGMTTSSGGVRIDTSSLTAIGVTWEHQWRSDQRTVDRVYAAVVQTIP